MESPILPKWFRLDFWANRFYTQKCNVTKLIQTNDFHVFILQKKNTKTRSEQVYHAIAFTALSLYRLEFQISGSGLLECITFHHVSSTSLTV